MEDTYATPRGMLVVISGPSGVGKTTIVRRVREELNAIFSISSTTRPQTPQDRDGIDYDFIDEPRFTKMIDEKAFLEYAHVFGRYWYGTPRAPVEAALAAGKTVVLEIDVQGALQIRENAPDALMVFILPPDYETLLTRLRQRARDDDEAIDRRFEEAKHEISLARESNAYDAFVVNDDLDGAIIEACDIIRSAQVAR